MMTMRDEYVRWALKPPFGGHYGGLFTPAWKALHFDVGHMLVKKQNT